MKHVTPSVEWMVPLLICFSQKRSSDAPNFHEAPYLPTGKANNLSIQKRMGRKAMEIFYVCF